MIGSLLRTGYDNLRARGRLESRLQRMEGESFHVPYLDIDEEQIFRQRPDHEELLWEFYNLPKENDTDLKAGDIVYEVEEVAVIESGELVYKAKRFLDRAGFDGNVRLTLDFGDVTPQSVRKLSDYPLYERIDGKAWIERDIPESGDVDSIRDRLVFLHPWSGPDRFDVSLLNLNRSLAALWNDPDTIQETREAKVRWERYNRDRERWR